MTTTAALPEDDETDALPPRRSPLVPLSLMMLLQYAVWGIWLPILANYLGTPVAAGGVGFSNGQIGAILGFAASAGAITSPFIAGQLADRVMNAERALGILLILGGIVQALLTWQTSFPVWLVLLTLYSVLYMPTLALTNSVAFANLSDRERQFPAVRTFGTIGWIVGSVGFALAFMQVNVGPVRHWPFLEGTPVADAGSQMKYALLVAGVVSIAYGALCFLILPKTPPRRESARPLAFAAAFRLLTRPGCVALLVAALLVSMIHQVYFFRMGDYVERIWGTKSAIAPTMAIGQVSEIVFLAILGLFIRQVGYKWIITLGALSYIVRYGAFALFPTTGAVQLAMLTHGMSYGFFFAGSYLFVERIAPADIRHSIQTVFGIIILGLGPILAFLYNNLLTSVATRDGVVAVAVPGPTTTIGAAATLPTTTTDFGTLWLVQAGVAAAAMLVLIVAFPGRVGGTPSSRAGQVPLEPEVA